ncbi:hypothetical protein Tco_1204632 [Tanacetum coccineum]
MLSYDESTFERKLEKFWVVGSGGSVSRTELALQLNQTGCPAYKVSIDQALVGDGGRRDKTFLHMLCVLDNFLDVLFKCVKLVKFLLYLVSRHGWLGLSTQPTPRELGGVEKFKALGDNGVMSGSRVEVVWMEVGGGIVRAKVVSRVVLGLVMKVVLVMLRGFWVEELALDAIEYDDQGMSMRKDVCRTGAADSFGSNGTDLLQMEPAVSALVEVGSCKEWDQECSYLRDHFPSFGEELEKENRMTQNWMEMELGDEAFFPYP